MKKAFTWLDENKITYTFYNYKTETLCKTKIEEWLKTYTIAQLINTKGSTYRNLSDGDKLAISKKNTAIKLMIENTSMIKRPLIETDKGIFLGFKLDEWEKIFS